jgi:hypothetical protein
MLVLIETDSSIPDKYKVHIKNQLSIIVNGGSAGVSAETSGSGTTIDTVSTWGGILGFISGFIKIFFIIVGIILFIGVIGFMFYRLSRKDDNIWFQDFLIDSVFHSRKATPITVDTTSASVVINGAPPLPREDPLVSYTPPTSTPVSSVKSAPIDPLAIVTPIAVVEPTIAVSQPIEMSQTTNDSVPDWLKATSNIEKEIPKIESTPIAHPIDSMSPLFEVNIAEPVAIDPIPTTVLSDDGIPDWIKNTPTTETTQILDPLSHSDTKRSSQSKSEVSPTSERLPDWLMNSIQSDTIPETDVVDTLPETPMMTETAETNIVVVKKSQKKSKKTQTIQSEGTTTTDTSDIPNWLK